MGAEVPSVWERFQVEITYKVNLTVVWIPNPSWCRKELASNSVGTGKTRNIHTDSTEELSIPVRCQS